MGELLTYIEVPAAATALSHYKPLELPVAPDTTRIDGTTVHTALREEFEISSVPELRTARAVEQFVTERNEQYPQNEATQKAIEFTKQLMSGLLTAVSLPAILPEQMPALFSPDTLHDLLCDTFRFKKEEGYPDGFSSFLTNTVFVRDQGIYPRYIVSGLLLHELVHAWCDVRIGAFTPVSNGNEQKILYQTRRVGLHLLNGQDPSRGLLLTELGNHLLQWNFLQAVTGRTIGDGQFDEELAERDRQLMRHFNVDSVDKVPSYDIYSLNNRPDSIIFRKDLIHFDKSGNLINLFSVPTLTMQLAADIETLTLAKKTAHQEPLASLWLQAKANPKKQRALARTIDGAMYPGFYAKLKSTDHDGNKLIDLICEVQGAIGSC